MVKLHLVWRSAVIGRDVKIKLFKATVEIDLLYNVTTWTVTAYLEQSLDFAYTKLLRYALNISWREHKTCMEIYFESEYVWDRGVLILLAIAGEATEIQINHCNNCCFGQFEKVPLEDAIFYLM